VDLVGTGGDGKATFNISTTAAFVVAGAGQKVAKHGNYGASSPCGSSNVLEALGVPFRRNEEDLLRDLERSGFCFMHAPFFHPAMKNVGPIRKELGVRTFFNLLGPVANPASPKNKALGVCSFDLLRLTTTCCSVWTGISRSCIRSGANDEVSLTDRWKVVSRHEERVYEPRDVGLEAVPPDELSCASIEQGVKTLLAVLKGEASGSQTNVVTVNAAFALRCARPAMSLDDALAAARSRCSRGAPCGCWRRCAPGERERKRYGHSRYDRVAHKRKEVEELKSSIRPPCGEEPLFRGAARVARKYLKRPDRVGGDRRNQAALAVARRAQSADIGRAALDRLHAGRRLGTVDSDRQQVLRRQQRRSDHRAQVQLLPDPAQGFRGRRIPGVEAKSIGADAVLRSPASSIAAPCAASPRSRTISGSKCCSKSTRSRAAAEPVRCGGRGGVNNRNLDDFSVDPGLSLALAGRIPGLGRQGRRVGHRRPGDGLRAGRGRLRGFPDRRSFHEPEPAGRGLPRPDRGRQANPRPADGRSGAVRSVKVKICGMRDPQNIDDVARLGPDYLGFIFSPASPRFVGTRLNTMQMRHSTARSARSGSSSTSRSTRSCARRMPIF
jgi:anthranilate phosphoribosyltransferase